MCKLVRTEGDPKLLRLFLKILPKLSRLGGNNECKQYVIPNAALNNFPYKDKSTSTASALQVEANLQEQLSVHLHFRLVVSKWDNILHLC